MTIPPKRNKKGQFVLGHQTYGLTHGMYDSHFYRKYYASRQHCDYPNSTGYQNYGGRGIKFLWGRFEEFRDDMYESYLKHVAVHGKRNTTLDRIDVNGNYSKDNCRWATMKVQARNKRNNRFITANGVTKTLAEWAEDVEIHQTTILNRLARGWSPEKAVSNKRYNKYGKSLVFTHNGETLSLKKWSERIGIRYNTLYGRLFVSKMPLEKAFTTKVV